MAKRMILFAIMAALAFSSRSMAAQNYEEELATQKQELAKISPQITALNEKFKQLKIEYINADIKLRQELAAETSKTGTTKGDEKTTKETVRKAKEKQAELRKTYYGNKKPLSAQMNELKTSQAQCNRKIKKLEKKIKAAKEGKGEDEEYINQMASLRQELGQAKEELDLALKALKDEADAKIAAITDKNNKAKESKKIMSETRDKEIELWKNYNSKKEQIGLQIRRVKAEYRARVKENIEQIKKVQTEQRAQEELVKTKEGPSGKKGPKQNFGPAR